MHGFQHRVVLIAKCHFALLMPILNALAEVAVFYLDQVAAPFRRKIAKSFFSYIQPHPVLLFTGWWKYGNGSGNTEINGDLTI